MTCTHNHIIASRRLVQTIAHLACPPNVTFLPECTLSRVHRWQKNYAVSSAIQTRVLMNGITNKLSLQNFKKRSECAHLVAANYEFACLALRLPFTTYICRGTLIRDRCLQSSCFTAVSIFCLFPLRALGRLMLLAVANPALDFVSLPLWLTRCRILRRSLCLSSCVHYFRTPRWR